MDSAIHSCFGLSKFMFTGVNPSSETQGQLVGARELSGQLYFQAKVHNNFGRALGPFPLPSQFQEGLNSCLLIGQKKIYPDQSMSRISWATLLSSYTRWFSVVFPWSSRNRGFSSKVSEENSTKSRKSQAVLFFLNGEK